MRHRASGEREEKHKMGGPIGACQFNECLRCASPDPVRNSPSRQHLRPQVKGMAKTPWFGQVDKGLWSIFYGRRTVNWILVNDDYKVETTTSIQVFGYFHVCRYGIYYIHTIQSALMNRPMLYHNRDNGTSPQVTIDSLSEESHSLTLTEASPLLALVLCPERRQY